MDVGHAEASYPTRWLDRWIATETIFETLNSLTWGYFWGMRWVCGCSYTFLKCPYMIYLSVIFCPTICLSAYLFLIRSNLIYLLQNKHIKPEVQRHRLLPCRGLAVAVKRDGTRKKHVLDQKTILPANVHQRSFGRFHFISCLMVFPMTKPNWQPSHFQLSGPFGGSFWPQGGSGTVATCFWNNSKLSQHNLTGWMKWMYVSHASK